MIDKNSTKEKKLEEIFERLSKLECSMEEEISERLSKLEPRIKFLETEIFVAIEEMIKISKKYAGYESRIKELPNKLYFFIDREFNNDN